MVNRLSGLTGEDKRAAAVLVRKERIG